MRKVLLLSIIYCISSGCKSQKLPHDSLLIHARISYDSLWRQLVYKEKYVDSIKIYEYNIMREIDIAIQKLRKDNSINPEEERNALIERLNEYKKRVSTIGMLSRVLATSYGRIPREAGLKAAMLHFNMLKNEYFMLMEILDNAYSTFFLSWDD